MPDYRLVYDDGRADAPPADDIHARDAEQATILAQRCLDATVGVTKGVLCRGPVIVAILKRRT